MNCVCNYISLHGVYILSEQLDKVKVEKINFIVFIKIVVKTNVCSYNYLKGGNKCAYINFEII